MEKNERMSKRFGLLGAMLGLVMIGFLLACGSSFNSSTDGLLIVGSQGSSALQTFSFTLNNGHVSSIANPTNDTANETCLLNGSPAGMVTNPTGTFVFVIFNSSNQCPNATKPGIATFAVGSDGNVKQVGSLQSDPSPVSLAMDPAGKFLFVAEGGGVNVYSIGSEGGLTLVPGAYSFVLPPGFFPPNIVSVAPSPTVFPGTGINGTQNSVCQAPTNVPPSTQYLYAVDSINNVVWEYSVNTSTGALGNSNAGGVAHFATGQVPAGVAVDPCARFVYVSESLTNRISGYTICMAVLSPNCPNADGSLVPVSGSPFPLSGSANGPGQIAVSPFGNNVYVVGTLSNTVSGFTISPVSGSLTALSPATVATGTGPVSMTIRADNNWMFVSNFGSVAQGGSTVSQYAITPATGALSVGQAIQTDNYPFGVAVK